MRNHSAIRLLFLLPLALCLPVSGQITAIGNGASSRIDQPLTPGSWAIAVGNFTGATTETAGYPLPKTLGGVTVSVDGIAAPIYYTLSTQLAFVIPSTVTPGIRPVEVKVGSSTYTANIRVSTAGPGLFVNYTQNPVNGAIRNQDVSINSPANPTRRGDVISIYGTGTGALSQTVQDGVAVPNSPLVTTVSMPQVYIGGVLAKVEFSGLSPGAASLWQINVDVPNLPFITGRVPVRVFMDGVDSNEVTVIVAQ